MVRSRMVTLTASIHTVYAVIIGGIALYCFWMVQAIATSGQPKAHVAAQAMIVGGCVVGVVAVVYAAASMGLWRAKRWAWWLSVVINLLAIAGMLADMFGGDFDPEDLIPMLLLAVPVVCLFLPGVRRLPDSPPATS